MDRSALARTLRALEVVARAGPEDALVREARSFRQQCEARTTSHEELEGALDVWLAQTIGALLGRVDLVLQRGGDGHAVREVLRALWVLFDRHKVHAHAELTELGGLLSTALADGDAAAARRLVNAAQAWFAEHQREIAAMLRGAIRKP